MILWGGDTGPEPSDSAVYVFDVERNHWLAMPTPNGPSGRSFHTVGLLGRQMLLFGGMNPESLKLNELWSLDIGALRNMSNRLI
jgi:hypothetical protein